MKAYLHIGGEKTGTTTIQEFCRVNRATLAQMGFLYPSSLGSSNHLKLTAYALGDNDFDDDTRKHFGIRNKWDLEKFRSTVEHDLTQEVEQARDATTAILSNELIQSRLTDVAELTRLSTLLNSCFSDIRILVYLRRQDRVAISHYSTQLKSDSESGPLVFPIISGNDELPPYFDYNRMLNHLEIVFGKSNIEVRLFEIESLKDGDLLTDFRSFCDITERETFEQVERENESLSPSAIAFYKHLNTVVPRFVYDAPNPLRLGLNAAMSKEFAGRGPQVTAVMARTFYSNFLPGNREISRRYFANGDPDLFSGDFSMYREELVEELEPSELIEIAAHLWLERSVEVERLKLETYLARFSLAICKLKKPPAPPPSTGVGAHTPGNLAVQWLGALLYLGEDDRAAEAARILSNSTPMQVYTVARLFAISRIDDERLEDEMARAHVGAKIRDSISFLKRAGAERLQEDAMVRVFQTGDPICQQVHKRLFEWMELP